MLQITPEQMDRIALDTAADHVARLADFIATMFPDQAPEQAADRTALRHHVARMRDEARGWGITEDADLRQVMVLRFTYGPGFSGLAWVAGITGDPFGRKLDRLIAQAHRETTP